MMSYIELTLKLMISFDLGMSPHYFILKKVVFAHT